MIELLHVLRVRAANNSLDDKTRSIERQAADKIERLHDVLIEHDEWEGELLLDREAWRPGDALPKFTQTLFDRLLDLQRLRSEALL